MKISVSRFRAMVEHIRGRGVGRHEGELLNQQGGDQKFSSGGERGGNNENFFLKFQKTAKILSLACKSQNFCPPLAARGGSTK